MCRLSWFRAAFHPPNPKEATRVPAQSHAPDQPVDFAQELDIKMDDGVLETGVLRLAIDVGAGAVFGAIGESDPGCHASGVYSISAGAQDCNPVFLY